MDEMGKGKGFTDISPIDQGGASIGEEDDDLREKLESPSYGAQAFDNDPRGFGPVGAHMDRGVDGQTVSETLTMASFVVFILGFCCCPIWFGGFWFIRKGGKVAKLFGVLSSAMAVLVLVAGTTVIVKMALESNPCRRYKDADKCLHGGCGWCTSHSHCAEQSDCSSGKWITHSSTYCDHYGQRNSTICGQFAPFCEWCDIIPACVIHSLCEHKRMANPSLVPVSMAPTPPQPLTGSPSNGTDS